MQTEWLACAVNFLETENLAALRMQHAAGYKLTIHVIAFRYEGFSWTGSGSVMDLMCVAQENGGLYIKANSEEELVEALEKTLDCPMVSQAPLKQLMR